MVNQVQLIKVRINKEAAGEQLCPKVEKGVNLDLQLLDGLPRLRQSVERQKMTHRPVVLSLPAAHGSCSHAL